jgi:dolichol-phosphate mannosyltransferase
MSRATTASVTVDPFSSERIDGSGVLIVTPTLNERDSIEPLIRGIRTFAPGAHMLIVDDGSTDGTAEAAAELGRTGQDVHVLQRGRKLGIGSAYQDGFQWGLERTYDRFISMDGDLSHDPRYLPALIGATTTDADLAVGSRYLHGVSVVNWGLSRLALSVIANRYARTITGMAVRDTTSGFQCFRRAVLETINPRSFRFTGYAFLVELKYRAFQHGFRIREVPIIFVDRRFGFSKLGMRHVAQSTWAVWVMRLGPRPPRTRR